MKIIVSPEAKREQRDALHWYRSNSSEAADRFRDELNAIVQRIAGAPKQFPQISRGQRRALFTKFPYAIVFEEGAEQITIIAIAHTSRLPDYWQGR